MADSAVRYQDIDEEFPIAGQDNDSQGFRDNFSETKQALQQANVELTDLLTNGARLDEDNDFNGNDLINGSLLQVTEKVYNTGNINANTPVNWTDGHYQNITVTANVTLTLGAWPSSGNMGKMRLALRSDGSTRTVIWEADNAGTMFKDSNWPAGDFNVSSLTNPVIIDVWTTDGGATVFFEYKGLYSS